MSDVQSNFASEKRTATFTAHLERPGWHGPVWRIVITHPGPDGVSPLVVSASFPRELAEQARRRFEEIENDTDVEDLLREFGYEDERDHFQLVASEST